MHSSNLAASSTFLSAVLGRRGRERERARGRYRSDAALHSGEVWGRERGRYARGGVASSGEAGGEDAPPDSAPDHWIDRKLFTLVGDAGGERRHLHLSSAADEGLLVPLRTSQRTQAHWTRVRIESRL